MYKLMQFKLYIGAYSVFNEPTKTRRCMAAREPRVVYSYAEEIALTTQLQLAGPRGKITAPSDK